MGSKNSPTLPLNQNIKLFYSSIVEKMGKFIGFFKMNWAQTMCHYVSLIVIYFEVIISFQRNFSHIAQPTFLHSATEKNNIWIFFKIFRP